MSRRDMPIRRKLMAIILLTSGVVSLLTYAAFFAYEFLTFRQSMVQQLSTLGEIVAANSTAALAFDNQDDAREILAALKAEQHIVAASLYDKNGNLFSRYPESNPAGAFPAAPEEDGYRFVQSHLTAFQPVVQGDNKRLGTLYLKSDMGAMYERFRLYGEIVALVIAGSFIVAYMLSRMLQKQISQPILALAETAKAVSVRRDFSVRAEKLGGGELGLLTDAFNQMLMEIHEQNSALSESEARVRAVLNSALSAVLVIDARGRITDWNPQAEKMFGWTRQEALGMELAETIIPPRYREAHQRGLNRFLATGEGPVMNQLLEMSALRRDGSEFPVELSISLMNADGAAAFCGFITDITERKRADEALRESEERFRTMADSAPVLIWVSGPDKLCTWFNRQWLEFVGRTMDQELGNGWAENVHPDDFERCLNIYTTSFDARQAFSMEYRLRRHDGAWRWLVDQGIPRYGPSQEFAGYIGSCIDITERKESEVRLREYLKEISDLKTALDEHAIVAITDQTGKIIYVNEKFCAISKYSREELLGRDHRIINSGYHPKEFIRELWTTIANGKVWHGEIKNRAKDGSIYWVDTTIVPFLNEQGKPRQYVAIRSDITQRKLAQEVLIKQSEELTRSNKDLEQFAYIASHDLQEPLRAVAGCLQILQRRYQNQLDAGADELIDLAVDGAHRLQVLIDGLLTFSRVGTRGKRLQSVDCEQAVGDALKNLSVAIEESSAAVTYDKLPKVMGDLTQLTLLFQNLIGNAIKFRQKEQPPQIHIGAEENGRLWILSVRDNGIGIAPQYYERIFEIFQRLHTRQEYPGTGIGLAICRKIVERHGGKIWVESAAQKGSKFLFHLPKTVIAHGFDETKQPD